MTGNADGSRFGLVIALQWWGQAVGAGREAGNHHWWRRGDSTSTAFAAGWTMPSSSSSHEREDAERVIPLMESVGILVPAQAFAVGESMSLYRAGLKLAFFLPLGVAMPPFFRKMPSGFTDVSSVINQPSRVGATSDRTPVRKR